jgi:hypothetical protein
LCGRVAIDRWQPIRLLRPLPSELGNSRRFRQGFALDVYVTPAKAGIRISTA